MVKSMGKDKAMISLVNALTGTLLMSELSDEDANTMESLEVDAFVTCVVLSTAEESDKKMLKLSMKASLLNKFSVQNDPLFGTVGTFACGSIKSVEDHGVVVNLGSKKLTGFVPFDSPGFKKSPKVGQQIIGFITARPSKAVATMHIAPPGASVGQDKISFVNMLPGMLVDTKIIRRSLLDGGVLVSFCSLFQATADWFHRGAIRASRDDDDEEDAEDEFLEEAESDVQRGGIRKARIVWVDPNAKLVGVSFAEHVLRRKIPKGLLGSISSSIAQEGEIVQVHPRLGVKVLLPCPNDSEANILGFANLSRLIEGSTLPLAAQIKKDYIIGQTTTCRVVDSSPMDGLALVSLQKSVIKASVTSYDGVKPGMKLTGKVVKIDPSFGILLEIGQNVKGLVTLIHLSDSGLESAPENRFKLGQQCKARVLTVNADRVQLTMKKSLVDSDLPIISSYVDAAVGIVSQGFVTKVDDFGLIVTFFANVHGIVPIHTLGAKLTNPKDMFHVSCAALPPPPSPILSLHTHTHKHR